ncbi:MAG TPA: hypothetical protein VFQ35_25785 [Polyangiaceae bacterium]|nr:hypothetical protein [Polyangiaceae bacterium]
MRLIADFAVPGATFCTTPSRTSGLNESLSLQLASKVLTATLPDFPAAFSYKPKVESERTAFTGTTPRSWKGSEYGGGLGFASAGAGGGSVSGGVGAATAGAFSGAGAATGADAGP